MKNPYSVFATKELERSLAELYAELDTLTALHVKVSSRLDHTALLLETVRHELSVRRMARRQWNGRKVNIEIVETSAG
jgi:7,8-dihydro-6-hydroxymethylpterin-pyrophosphokinase